MLTRKTRPRKRADQSGSIITTIPLISFVYFLAPAASQPNLKLVTSHEKFSNNFKIYLRPPIQVFARAQDYFRVGPPPLLRLHARFQSFFLDVSWRVRRSLFLALRLLLSPPPSLNQPSPPLPRTPSTLMPIHPSSLLCLCASRRGKAHCRIERLSPVAAHILVDLPAPPQHNAIHPPKKAIIHGPFLPRSAVLVLRRRSAFRPFCRKGILPLPLPVLPPNPSGRGPAG